MTRGAGSELGKGGGVITSGGKPRRQTGRQTENVKMLRRTEEEIFPSNVKKRKEEGMSGNGLGSW
jgi:hypothetical protein